MSARTFGDLRFVLLWSDEHRAWWRPDGMGYTTKIDEAGIYDPDTVVQRWLHGGSGESQCGRAAPQEGVSHG